MLDPTTEQIGVGGLVAVLLVSAVLKFLPSFLSAMKPNGNGRAAGRTAAEWDTQIRQAVKEALVDNAPKRHEDLRKLMEEVVERELAARNETLRQMMKEVIGDWADARFGRERRERDT